MVHTRTSIRNGFADKHAAFGDSSVLLPKRRQIPTLILLLALMCAPVRGVAQSDGQGKRGIGLPPPTGQTSAPVTPTAPSDKPELILQTGHTKSANAVSFSPDNRWLASGGKDNAIKIWDLATGYVLRTLYGHASNVNALAVSPDGKLLASGSGDINDKRDLSTFTKGGVVGGTEDNTVRIWDVQTGRESRVLRGHELPVGAVAFSKDGRFLTSASGDSVKVWDVAAGSELRSQKTNYEKSGREKFDSASNKMFFVFGSGDKRVVEEARRVKNFKLSASKMAVSLGGQLAAVGQPDKEVRIYDAQSGRQVRELPFKALPEAENSSLAFSPDARLIAFARTSDVVSVQEAATGRELYSVNTGFSMSPQRVQFSADGRFLVTSAEGGTSGGRAATKLWNATTGQAIRELDGGGGDTQVGVRVLSISHDGSMIATVAAGAKVIRITEAATGRESRALQTGTTDEGVRAEQAAFIKSVDPKTMAKLRERGIATPEQIVEAVEAIATTSNDRLQAGGAVSFSPDGRWIVTRHVLMKNMVTEVWDAATGTLLRTPDDSALRDWGKPLFSPNGRFRATPFFAMKSIYDVSVNDYLGFFGDDWDNAYKQRIKLYDGKTDKQLRELDGGKATALGIAPAAGFSSDGSLIAMTGFEKKERSVLIFETATGRRVNRFKINDDEQSGAVTTLCISTDTRLLAAGYATKIDIFEIASGRTLRTLPHAGRVASLSFSPDGHFLVALGENNDKYIWDATTGEKLATLVNLSGAFNSRVSDWLVVTPDGLFDGSPSGWNQILWQFGGNSFDVTPAETFFNEFYYPGLLAEIMAGKKPRAPRNISRLDRRQPEIKLTTLNGQTGSVGGSERNLKLRIEVSEVPADKDHKAGSGARDVRLFRNGSLVKVWRGDVIKGQTANTLEATIPIVAGENRLTAYAFNRDNVKSKDVALSITGAAGLKRAGTFYVLAVGLNSYSNPLYDLKYAVADAEAFGEEVRRQQQKLGNHERFEVVPLLNEQATKANILRALKRLAGVEETWPADTPAALEKLKATQPEDTVIIYFAGHGTAQGQRFYLLPHDLGYSGERTVLDPAGLRAILENSISDEELEQVVEGIDANNLLMVIDACNSGQALEAEEKRRGPMNSKGLAQLAYEKGMYILTAAQSFQAAQEVSQLGHGLLTFVLVDEGLKKAGADREPQDGTILVKEWLDYATQRVPDVQLDKIKQAREIGLDLFFVEEERGIGVTVEKRSGQRPRAFYRREQGVQQMVVARP